MVKPELFTKIVDFTPVFLRKRAIWLISTLLAIFNTLWLCSVVYKNWSLFIAFQWHIDWKFLAFSFFFYSINLFIVTLGWYQLVRHFRLGGTFRTHFEIFVLNELSKRIPGKFWYVAGRIMMYQQYGIRKTEVVVASGLETVLMMNGALIGYLFATPFSNRGQHLGISLIGLCIASLLLAHPKVINWILVLMKRREVMNDLSFHQFIGLLLLYSSGWLCGGYMLYWWLRALSPSSQLPLFNIIMVWTFTGVLSNLLWFLPGTFGVRELALTVLISQFVDTPTALVASILLRILLMGYQLIFGSFVLLLRAYLKHTEQVTPI